MGAVNDFEVKTLIYQVWTATILFPAAKGLKNMTGLSKYRNTIPFGKMKYIVSKVDPELSLTRNCRVHCNKYKKRHNATKPGFQRFNKVLMWQELKMKDGSEEKMMQLL